MSNQCSLAGYEISCNVCAYSISSLHMKTCKIILPIIYLVHWIFIVSFISLKGHLKLVENLASERLYIHYMYTIAVKTGVSHIHALVLTAIFLTSL